MIWQPMQVSSDIDIEIEWDSPTPHLSFSTASISILEQNKVLEAVLLCSEGKISNRMQVISMFPEMNPGMDSYRYV